MPRFRHYNYDQDAMVVINYQEQLQPGTFEHAVHYLIEHKLDLSVFHPKYRNDDTGRLAYDPAILLKIILFAYSKGITSSREMQWCCETNMIFKALSCDTVPHFTTLAKFVSSHADEIEELFEQVLPKRAFRTVDTRLRSLLEPKRIPMHRNLENLPLTGESKNLAGRRQENSQTGFSTASLVLSWRSKIDLA
jgi:transposase